jgi:hypothetical protein
MEMGDSIFDTTMMGLETGLQVQHIATLEGELCTCNIDDNRDCVALFTDSQFEDFDQIPIRKGRSIVGIITKGCEGLWWTLLSRQKSACVKIQNPPSLLVKNLEGQVRFMSL